MSLHAQTLITADTHMHSPTRTRTHTHTHAPARTHTYTYTCTCTHAHTHTHTHTHTHKHTHTAPRDRVHARHRDGHQRGASDHQSSVQVSVLVLIAVPLKQCAREHAVLTHQALSVRPILSVLSSYLSSAPICPQLLSVRSSCLSSALFCQTHPDPVCLLFQRWFTLSVSSPRPFLAKKTSSNYDAHPHHRDTEYCSYHPTFSPISPPPAPPCTYIHTYIHTCLSSHT
jgi:hypothetical protein